MLAMNIEERVTRLEKANRLYRLTALGCVLFLTALGSAGFLIQEKQQDLVASSLTIVNANGRKVIELRPQGDKDGLIWIRTSSSGGGIRQASDETLTCRANLQTLSNAARAYQVKHKVDS